MDFQAMGRGAATIAAIGITLTARAQMMTGTVTADGKPVAGATVMAQPATPGGGQVFGKPVTTDAKGAFALELPDDSTLDAVRKKYGVPVFMYAPGFALAQASYKPGQPLAIALLPEQTLRGTVRDAGGKPVANAPVSLAAYMSKDGRSGRSFIPVPAPFTALFAAKTDAEGRFELGGVPANAPGAETMAIMAFADPRYVPVTYAGVARESIALIARIGGTISGTVMNSGAATAGVQVVATLRNFFTIRPGRTVATATKPSPTLRARSGSRNSRREHTKSRSMPWRWTGWRKVCRGSRLQRARKRFLLRLSRSPAARLSPAKS